MINMKEGILDMKNRIIYIVNHINRLYKDRNIDNLRNAYDSLLSNDAVLIGTSPTEICLTKDSIIRLFESDFKGWGDFQVKTSTLKLQETKHLVLASFKSDLSISFENKENTFEIFKHIFKENDDFIQNKKTAALKNIWLLQHILKNRDKTKRTYTWEFDFHLIVNKQNSKISLIHFAYPFEKDMYDIILGLDSYDDQMYFKEVNMFLPDAINGIIQKNLEKTYQLERVQEFIVEEEFIYFGVGTRTYNIDFNSYYTNQTKYLEGKEESLFHIQRDLIWGLLLDSLNPIKTPFRIIGIRDENEVLYQVITYPYQVILENKSRNEVRH